MGLKPRVKKGKMKSKATKKGWRKHTNVKDVEEHLENERLQLRTGGLVSEKKDSSLYVIDKKKFNKNDKCRTKAEWRAKVLHNEIVHLNDTDPVVTPRTTPTRSLKSQPITDKKLEAIDRGTAGQKNSEFRDTAGTYDLWATGESNTGEVQDDFYLEVTRQKAPKPTKTIHSKPSLIPAVEVIHPGGSYNPTKEHHKDLLKQVLRTENKVLKKSQRIKSYFKYLKDGMIDEVTIMAEMAEGLSADQLATEQSEIEKRALLKNQQKENKMKQKNQNLDKDKDSDSEISDSESDSNELPPSLSESAGGQPSLEDVLPEKGEIETQEKESGVLTTTVKSKSKKHKRKQLEEKLMKRAKAEVKRQNIKENDIFRLKSLTKVVKQSEKDVAKKVKKAMAKRTGASYRIKRLGKYRFEPMAQEFKLTSELPRSLRQLKPEGDPILDRYKSYQKRNYFEPRGSKEIREKKAKSRLRKGKYFEKRTYKEVDEEQNQQ